MDWEIELKEYGIRLGWGEKGLDASLGSNITIYENICLDPTLEQELFLAQKDHNGFLTSCNLSATSHPW